jgi:hypothetical protein
MAMNSSTSSRCGRLERGEDCSFDENLFFVVLISVFGSTMFLFIYQAWSVRNKFRTQAVLTIPQLSLLLAAGSCFLVSLDSLVMLGDIGRSTDNDHKFSFLGSIVLLTALFLFSERWCQVMECLKQRQINDWKSHEVGDCARPSKSIQVVARAVRFGYGFLALLHIPFVVIRVAQWPDRDLAITMFAWSVVIENVTLTVLGIFMSFIAIQMRCSLTFSKSEKSTKNSISQFCFVTLVNLIEQLAFNGAMIGIHQLYFSDEYMVRGDVQAKYFSLWFAVYWLMHIQLLIFFRFATFSDEAKVGLLSEDFASERELQMDCNTKQAMTTTTDAPSAEHQHCPDAKVNDAIQVDDINLSNATADEHLGPAAGTAIRGTMLGSPMLPHADAVPLSDDVSNPMDRILQGF